MRQHVDVMNSHQGGGAEGAFLAAVLDVRNDNLQSAAANTGARQVPPPRPWPSASFLLPLTTVRPSPPSPVAERARELLGVDLAALVGESYERAYADMVRVQQLTELEEVVVVKLAEKVANGACTAPGGLPLQYLPLRLLLPCCLGAAAIGQGRWGEKGSAPCCGILRLATS